MTLAVWLAAACPGWAAEAEGLRQVEQYNFSIHILAMLLVGFGFLMVFVKKHGYSATTGTYLVVGIGIPLYMFLGSSGVLPGEPFAPESLRSLLLAEFACASALIAMGAVLGRLKLYQYAVLAVFVVPAYMLNEWLVLNGGLEYTRGFVDTAGSVTIHAFGAYFGLGLAIALTSTRHLAQPIASDETSDRFSMLGSMVLWLFWPSFCSALVPASQLPRTVIATVLALCGATLATFVLSSILRKGKPLFADICTAALAGGVSVGATCNVLSAPEAFVVGVLAGSVSVFGCAVIQPKLQSRFKLIDTSGVHSLHGLPGLLGGLIAIYVMPGTARPQALGILVTVGLALATGVVSGYVILATGEKEEAYEDEPEFSAAE